MRLFAFMLFIAFAITSGAGSAFENKQLEVQVESLFTPGRDLAGVKFSVDQMAGGSTVAASAALDEMSAELRSIASGTQTSKAKLEHLKQYIYGPGGPNNRKPFSYDNSDPLGQNPANRYLARYIETRSGNCVTMPMLFVFLGERSASI